MLIVKLLAKSSTALANVRLRHIHAGFVNRLLVILENFESMIPHPTEPLTLSEPLASPPNNRPAVACCQGTGPSLPIPIALSPFH